MNALLLDQTSTISPAWCRPHDLDDYLGHCDPINDPQIQSFTSVTISLKIADLWLKLCLELN